MVANIQTYSTNAGRINIVKGKTLKHAVPVEVLSLGCTMEKMPKNSGDNVIYRRWLPYGATTSTASTINRWSVTAAAHIVSEGVTPPADTITPQDVSVTLQQYACLYSYTDKAAELYEDDIPEQQQIQCGERMGLVREMVRYGAMRGCTNAFYSGGTTRVTVDDVITLNFLRRIAQNLLANHAGMKNRVLSASANYDTSAIEAGFLVFCHTDCEPDIRDLQGFVPTAKYGQRSVISEYELGSCERFRFILSPELSAYADAGAAVSGTTLYSTTGTSADVYPIIVVGNDATFDVALRGSKSFDMTHIPYGQKDKSDPLGQRGYVGCKFWSAALVTNNGWMAVGEVARTSLS
jgi:N4-gp56 family major capsid protein